jgi:signal transduction histidine kinase
MIEQQGGKIWVELKSEKPGSGFYFTLPAGSES